MAIRYKIQKTTQSENVDNTAEASISSVIDFLEIIAINLKNKQNI
jgi:hypothetical protein